MDQKKSKEPAVVQMNKIKEELLISFPDADAREHLDFVWSHIQSYLTDNHGHVLCCSFRFHVELFVRMYAYAILMAEPQTCMILFSAETKAQSWGFINRVLEASVQSESFEADVHSFMERNKEKKQILLVLSYDECLFQLIKTFAPGRKPVIGLNHPVDLNQATLLNLMCVLGLKRSSLVRMMTDKSPIVEFPREIKFTDSKALKKSGQGPSIELSIDFSEVHIEDETHYLFSKTDRPMDENNVFSFLKHHKSDPIFRSMMNQGVIFVVPPKTKQRILTDEKYSVFKSHKVLSFDEMDPFARHDFPNRDHRVVVVWGYTQEDLVDVLFFFPFPLFMLISGGETIKAAVALFERANTFLLSAPSHKWEQFKHLPESMWG